MKNKKCCVIKNKTTFFSFSIFLENKSLKVMTMNYRNHETRVVGLLKYCKYKAVVTSSKTLSFPGPLLRG